MNLIVLQILSWSERFFIKIYVIHNNIPSLSISVLHLKKLMPFTNKNNNNLRNQKKEKNLFGLKWSQNGDWDYKQEVVFFSLIVILFQEI